MSPLDFEKTPKESRQFVGMRLPRGLLKRIDAIAAKTPYNRTQLFIAGAELVIAEYEEKYGPLKIDDSPAPVEQSPKKKPSKK